MNNPSTPSTQPQLFNGGMVLGLLVSMSSVAAAFALTDSAVLILGGMLILSMVVNFLGFENNSDEPKSSAHQFFTTVMYVAAAATILSICLSIS